MANKIIQINDNEGNNLYPSDYIRKTTLSLLNGWSDNGVYMTRVGNIVIFNCNVRYGTESVIATIPVGFRPAKSVMFPCVELQPSRTNGYIRAMRYTDRSEVETGLYGQTNISISGLLIWVTDD